MVGNLKQICNLLKMHGATTARITTPSANNHDFHSNLPSEDKVPCIEVKGNDVSLAESIIEELIKCL
jgi:hypothetical protein